MFLKISQILLETPALESLFNKVAGFAALLKRDFNTDVFL